MKTSNYKIVKLEAESIDKGAMFEHGGKLYLGGTYVNPYHLYILSDCPKQEGDSVIWKNNVFKIVSDKAYSGTSFIELGFGNQFEHVKKIIASTDTSLGVATIPMSLKKSYIKEFNRGKYLTNVNLAIDSQDNPLITNGEIVFHQATLKSFITINGSKAFINSFNSLYDAYVSAQNTQDFSKEVLIREVTSIEDFRKTYSEEEMLQNLVYCVSDLAAKLGDCSTADSMRDWNLATVEWFHNHKK